MNRLFFADFERSWVSNWAFDHLYRCAPASSHMARNWPPFPLFRYVAARHQHSNIRSHVLDGVRNPEHSES